MAMNQSGAVVGLGDCLINVEETLVFDAVFYRQARSQGGV